MEILIRKEKNGDVYIDRNNAIYYDTLHMSNPPYNYKKVIVSDVYADFTAKDFNPDTLEFDINRYNARKQTENNNVRILKIKQRLTELTQDFAQAYAGAVFEDLQQRVLEFQMLHNELRVLLGKSPRVYTNTNA